MGSYTTILGLSHTAKGPHNIEPNKDESFKSRIRLVFNPINDLEPVLLLPRVLQSRTRESFIFQVVVAVYEVFKDKPGWLRTSELISAPQVFFQKKKSNIARVSWIVFRAVLRRDVLGN